MPINLDFVGLNTLVNEPITSSTNTIGHQPHEHIVRRALANKYVNDGGSATNYYIASKESGFSGYTTTGPLSITFWAKIDINEAVRSTHASYVLFGNTAVSNDSLGLLFMHTAKDGNNYTAGQIRFAVQEGANVNQFHWTSVGTSWGVLGSLKHFAIVWDGDKDTDPVLYINGEQTVDSQFQFSVSSRNMTTSTRNNVGLLRVGGLNLDENNLHGSMSELVLWKKQLSSVEIESFYNYKKQRFVDYSIYASDIIDYWKLGEDIDGSLRFGNTVPPSTTIVSSISNNNLAVSANTTVQRGPAFDSVFNPNIVTGGSVVSNYLAALNIHRNGPYGYPTFKQIRSHQNPLTRYHNKNSIFSYVSEVGDIKQTFKGSQLLSTHRDRRGQLFQITESPIISSNRPLMVVGSVQTDSEDPSELDRVEILTSFGNENQYFGNKEVNRHHDLIYDVDEGYEDLTDLYLDGGLDSDDSPFDQFELLRYSHMIYPKAGNTYLGEVRSRENFISGYWRDLRTNRNEIDSIDNGFGFTIPSQSIWPLDVEDDWATRALNATQGAFTASIPCDFDFNTTSASAGGIEFQEAQISFFAHSPLGSIGTDATYTTATVSGVASYRIRGERFSLSSVQGTTNFWNAWSAAFQAGNFRMDNLVTTYVTRSAYTAPTTFGSSEPFYLQIHPTSFVASKWKDEFDNMHLHFWGRNLDNTSQNGYIYRETDSFGRNRRSVRLESTNILVELSTEYTNTFEDGTTSTYVGTTTESGSVQFAYDLAPEYASNLGRFWNNYVIEMKTRDAISSEDNFAIYSNAIPRGVLDGSVSLQDPLGFYSTDSVARTIVASTAQGKNTLDSSTNGFSHIGNLGMGTAERLITFFLKVIGFATQTIFKFYSNDENFIEGIISGEVLTISISSTSSGGLRTRISTFDISDHIGTLTKYIIWDDAFAGFYKAVKLYAYTSDGLVEIPGEETVFPPSEIRAALPLSFQQYSLYSIPNDSAGGGQILADVALITGSFSNADLDLLANYGATIDFTSSYWTGPDPVAWWRLGNGSSDPANYDGSNASKKILHDYGVHAAGPFHITASAGFITSANSGPPRNQLAGANYYTSSVSEVFLLCKTSSTNNTSTDYFQNGQIAEIALFTGSAGFDESKYAVTPKYCFVDLTSSAVAPSPTASIWYTFENTDTITSAGANILNRAAASAFASYKLTGSYTGATRTGSKTEGLIVSGNAVFNFKANQPVQGQGTNQKLPGSGIHNFTPSVVEGDDALDTFFLGAGYNAQGSPGILQNSYNSFNSALLNTANNLDDQLYAAPSYTRRHSLSAFSSIGHPFGISPQIGAQRSLLDFELFQGTAIWETPEQSSRNPFYDTYSKYSEIMRLFAQDYSIVPEFRVSNHIDKFLKDSALDILSTDAPLLEITGGKSGAATSDTAEFFEVYSTTDFLKNFEIIQNDHKDFVDPLSITIRCKAIKKLLPYKGFYPVQRTVDIAKQFYSSYGSNLTLSSSFADRADADYAAQYLIQPLFSPGILFNTIKSGVACDYPIMTGSFATSSVPIGISTSGSFYINEQFHQRIPFEAIVEPEKFLANLPLGSQEPDPRGRAEANVIWNGQGDEKYRLMVSNFLAEVGDFYLNNSDYTTIASLPQGDPNFGNAEKGKTYMMRIRMYRSIEGRKDVWTTDPTKNYYTPSPTDRFGLPQDTGSMSQTITMYSRPSGFGPPQRLFLSGASGDNLSVKFNNWSEFKKEGSIDTFYTRNDSVAIAVDSGPTVPASTSTFADLQVDSDGHYLIGNDASEGYNYPFTPPYYHGEGWADITFKPTETKKIYTTRDYKPKLGRIFKIL